MPTQEEIDAAINASKAAVTAESGEASPVTVSTPLATVDVPQASGGVKTVVAPTASSALLGEKARVTKVGDSMFDQTGTIISETPTGATLRFINTTKRSRVEVFYLTSEFTKV